MMTTRCFLGITAHYIDERKITAKCIATKELNERHTSDSIAKNHEQLCQEFGLGKDKVTCVVTVKQIWWLLGSIGQSNFLSSAQKSNGADPPLKLILDAKTKWNSAYYMLEHYIKLSSEIHQTILQNTKAPCTPTAK
ncbi:hypothetical protein PR048_018767 [Dryococelus australis]|uniref:Uncharacterized protein n=1 Tax=Dryococelus australis TaxID=614101 RepID=A0ABQ9HDD7_9NEOP|nr:hypothetical protein PR048_018767 [Dryococelus australis]